MEKNPAFTFIDDVNNMRQTLFEATQVAQSAASTTAENSPSKSNTKVPVGKTNSLSNAPETNIMVLPVEWRKRLRFDQAHADDATIADVTLEGVPTFRTIVSDLLLDGIHTYEITHFKL